MLGSLDHTNADDLESLSWRCWRREISLAASAASSRVDDVSFDVPQGEIVGLIGPNGAGKTTVFNLVTRLYSPDGGDIAFEGESLLEPAAQGDRPRHRAYVPEPRALPHDDGARERPRRLARPQAAGGGGRPPRFRSSSTSAWRTSPTARRGRCRTASQKRVEAARALTSDPQAPAARRAGRRALSRGGRVPRRLRPPHARRLRADRARRRAPHAVRDGHLRPRARARLRPDDRERHARRGAGGPGRDRGLPRHARERDGNA